MVGWWSRFEPRSTPVQSKKITARVGKQVASKVLRVSESAPEEVCVSRRMFVNSLREHLRFLELRNWDLVVLGVGGRDCSSTCFAHLLCPHFELITTKFHVCVLRRRIFDFLVPRKECGMQWSLGNIFLKYIIPQLLFPKNML